MRLEEALARAGGALQMQRDEMSRWIYYRVHAVAHRFDTLIYTESSMQKKDYPIIASVESIEAVEGTCMLAAIATMQHYETDGWMACRLVYGDFTDL